MAISDDTQSLEVGGEFRQEFERTPPADLAAEQCVLGGMLLSKDAIADVVEIVRSADFYKPAHAIIFDTILDLYGRGEPADAIMVSAALADSGQLSKVGGAGYLHTLVSVVPTAANAAYYARIVAERAVLRRLVEAGTRIAQLGYGAVAGAGRDVDEIVDLAQQMIYDVTERRVSEDYAALGDLLQPTLDEIEAIGANDGEMTGIPTGFTDLDRLLNGLHPGQLIVVAGRPGLGKSTVAMDFVRSAAIKHGMTSLIFSLEMSKIEIVMRLLSAEARVPLHVIRSGQLSDDDWTKLARRMGEISEAPLFVDDTPNMTLMEIRAKARRLKQRNNLKLIVVDYLQLMASPKRVESRQQEVAELSRGLKLLAKEVECPVIAVSQLNRGPEQRTDKRPQLSDLRESGCLTADTRILRADTGAEVTLGELLASGARDVPVWTLDEKLRYVARPMTHVFPTGVKEVYRLRLASGRHVDATGNHPFLTFAGWRRLDELHPGDRLAVPRHVPAPLVTVRWSTAEVVFLAHLVGGGALMPDRSIRYANVDEASVDAVHEAALRGRPGRPHAGAAWLEKLGLVEQLHGTERGVPHGVFGLPKDQVALFLRHLWTTAGCVRWDADQEQATIHYTSPSRRLVDDVALLLLRFGIHTTIEATRESEGREAYRVVVSDRDDQLRFLRQIGAHGALAQQVTQYLTGVGARRRTTAREAVPREVWRKVREALTEPDAPRAAAGTRPWAGVRGDGDSGRDRLARVVAVLDDVELDMIATNDVYWDEILAIEALGPMPVYDATVLGTHNFVANGIAVHNSIEQDADVVLLLHREDYYDKESPRAGEADFIVAKHRNGPTDTVTVAAQLHLSRFVDMAVV